MQYIYTTKGKLPYAIILFSFIFGCCFYDYIQKNWGWSYTDEIIAFTLTLLLITRNRFSSKELRCLLCYFLFMLFYSLYTHVNTTQAIFNDFIIQIKSFLSFFAVYLLGFTISENRKQRLKKLCVVVSLFLIPIGIGGLDVQCFYFGHWSRYATLTSITSILFLYCSSFKRKDLFIATGMAALGLLSGTGKSLGFFIMFVCILWFNKKNMKLSIKKIFLAGLGFAFVIYFVWDDIQFYFIEGNTRDIETTFARTLMYTFFPIILNDFFPFGSGLGTFATSASCEYWSPIYRMYELDLNNEIGQKLFVTDAFYPSLAEFGYVGIFLFLLFWWLCIKKAYKYYLLNGNSNLLKCVIIIVLFFAIEGIADSTFTQNRGMFMMMILALFMYRSKMETAINTQNDNTLQDAR